MKYLINDATYTYLLLTDLAYENGLIPCDEYYERLRILKLLIDPGKKEQLQNVDVRIREFNDWEIGEYEDQVSYEEKAMGENKPEGAAASDDNFQGDDFNPVLHLITKNAGKISKWVFHKTDSDPFPSIPHGMQ